MNENYEKVEIIFNIMSSIMDNLRPDVQLTVACALMDVARAANKMTVDEYIENVIPLMRNLDEMFPFEEEENAEN